MILKGRAYMFGDDINTDDIIAAQYLNLTDGKALGKYCMENIDKDFIKKIKKSDIIVAGKNFGCGSSREHAARAIKGAGISCVIAQSFARIFFRNAINTGLPILELPKARSVKTGDVLEVHLQKGLIKNLSQHKTYVSKHFPEFMQELIKAGGLMQWVKKNKGKR
ncbi:3-isopropylmalate dehydratase small subunit [Candidatus Omnitrophota bacterium]